MGSLPRQLSVPRVMEVPQRQGHDLLRTGSRAPGVWLHQEPD